MSGVAAWLVSAAIAAVVPVHFERLDNGLSLLVDCDRSSPIVAVQAWAQVGSADESRRSSGVAHMLASGAREQTVGLEDGAESSVGAFWANLQVEYAMEKFDLYGSARYLSSSTDFAGMVPKYKATSWTYGGGVLCEARHRAIGWSARGA